MQVLFYQINPKYMSKTEKVPLDWPHTHQSRYKHSTKTSCVVQKISFGLNSEIRIRSKWIHNIHHASSNSKICIESKGDIFFFIGIHHARLLIFSYAPLKKVGLSLHGDEFHPIKWVRHIVKLRTA